MACFMTLIGVNVFAQLSPGDLFENHKHLEGMSNCTQCHTFGEGIPDAKCLACHKEVNALMKQNRGYHISKEVKPKACVDCHSDHHGRNFESIRFDEKSFDHQLAGYRLEGAHAKADCNSCHKSSNISDVKIAKRAGTYLGLDTKCLSCHEDFHQSTLSNTCTECHDMQAFKPAPKFSHEQTDYPLKGSHAVLDCKACHEPLVKAGKEFMTFKNMPHAKCTDCHEDEHQGQFGSNCLECHTESSFTTLKGNVNFNHNQTRYPLEGRHKTVNCKACHSGKSYAQSASFSTCKSCHADVHRGQFTSQANQDCDACHSLENGFQTTSFSIDRHQYLDFQLEGAHVATPCLSCHLQESKWVFKQIGSTCSDCHGDVHKNQMSNEFYSGSNCKDCHSSDSWTEINFDHEKTNYALAGKHASASCSSCHLDKKGGLTKANQTTFIKPATNCDACHDDEHRNQFAVNSVTDCSRCHANTKQWFADKFNHNETSFKLEGVHAQVNCAACHKPDSKELRYINYKIPKYQCIDCHQ